jgi:deoxyhypusine synthase
MSTVKRFIQHHYRHFNAAVVVDAAEAWCKHLDAGGKMLLTLGGAMSTAELGIVIAELIRRDKVHALCVTGANMEEDVFNLVAHDHYVRIPGYRYLTKEQEVELLQRHLNRVTDTCIPEEEAMRKIERTIVEIWQRWEKEGRRYFPYEPFYELIRSGVLEKEYQIDPKDAWIVAAAQKQLPLWTPGWEDSTVGNFYVSNVLRGSMSGFGMLKNGCEQMAALVSWYQEVAKDSSVGFFQVGGGISGDFPICVVPLIEQDLQKRTRKWGYFCQISESTTSYGAYSGAVPNEKITWGKLGVETPSFVIESDATIVFPLVAAYVLDQ